MNSIVSLKRKAKEIAKKENLSLKLAFKKLANELGFKDWKSCKDQRDTIWYQRGSGVINHWFKHHSEALDCLKLQGGYLLTYRGQFFVTTKVFIENLGLDPDDRVWQEINYDVSTPEGLNKIAKRFSFFFR